MGAPASSVLHAVGLVVTKRVRRAGVEDLTAKKSIVKCWISVWRVGGEPDRAFWSDRDSKTHTHYY